MSDIYEDLKAMAAEHGFVPAFKFEKDAPPGEVTITLISLSVEPEAAGFARLALHDTRESPTTQYLVETERLRAIIDHPAT